MDRQTDGQTDGQIDGQTNRWSDGQMEMDGTGWDGWMAHRYCNY